MIKFYFTDLFSGWKHRFFDKVLWHEWVVAFLMAQWFWLSCIEYSLFQLLKSPYYHIIVASSFNILFVKYDCTLLENLTFNSVLKVYVFRATIFSHIFFIVVLIMKSNYGENIYFSDLLIFIEGYRFLLILAFLKFFWHPINMQCCRRTILYPNIYLFKLKYFVGTTFYSFFIMLVPLSTKFCT